MNEHKHPGHSLRKHKKVEKIYEQFNDGSKFPVGYAKRTRKINSKTRKLKFIKEKNYVRNGGLVRSSFKISSAMMDDHEFVKNEIDYLFKQSVASYKKRLKLKFDFPGYDLKIGTDRNDFTMNLVTVLISFSRFENPNLRNR